MEPDPALQMAVDMQGMESNRSFYGPARGRIIQAPRRFRVVDEFRDIESAAKDCRLAMLVRGYDKGVPRQPRLLHTLSGVRTAHTLLRFLNGEHRPPSISLKSIWTQCDSLNC